MTMSYLKDPASIYEASFAAIRAEADLSRFEGEMEALAMRLIHACGMIDIAAGLRFSPSVVATASAALNNGAPVITDCEMVAAAIIRRLLPRSNEVICTLNDPQTPALAAKHETPRSAAAVSLWEPHVEGAVVASPRCRVVVLVEGIGAIAAVGKGRIRHDVILSGVVPKEPIATNLIRSLHRKDQRFSGATLDGHLINPKSRFQSLEW